MRAYPNVSHLRRACVDELIHVYGVDVPECATDEWVDAVMGRARARRERAAAKLLELAAHPMVYVHASPDIQVPDSDDLGKLVVGVDYGYEPSVTVFETWRVGPNGKPERMSVQDANGRVLWVASSEVAAQSIDRVKTCECFAANLCDEHRPIAVGDRVRWWPHGVDEDGALHVPDCYADGEITLVDRGVVRELRVSAAEGWPTAGAHGAIRHPVIGALWDPSISPGMMRRTVNRKCDHCEHISSAADVDELEVAIRTHAATHVLQAAPAEPSIAVGDYVRWEVDRETGTRWIEGEVKFVSDDGAAARISIDRSDGYRVGREIAVGLSFGTVTRRIPRPVHDVPTVETPWMRVEQGQVQCDPLDVEHDGVTLRDLLTAQQLADQTGATSRFTPMQRAVVSARWSAELRAKVEARARADAERALSVVVGIDPEDL